MCARELSGYPSGCFKTCGKMKGLWLRSLGAPGNRFAQPILQHEQEGLNHQKNVCLQEGWGAAAAVATSLASHYSLLENVSLAASLQLQMKAEHGEGPDSVGRRPWPKPQTCGQELAAAVPAPWRQASTGGRPQTSQQ